MLLLRGGHPIEADALADTQYRGISLGLPAWVERITWKKFMKTFSRDPNSRELVGWNVRVEQDSLSSPWTPLRDKNQRARTFGHYKVVSTEGRQMPNGTQRGLLIDYGLGANRLLDPLRRLRDPIVALRPDDPNLLLGWTYLDLGLGLHAATPSFFSLELDGPLMQQDAPNSRAA